MLCATLAMAAVDVNKATEAQLDAVKGIGPVTSKLIMTERKGDFKSWQDFIDRVKGVGDTRAAKLSDEGLTVNGAAFKPTAKDSKAAAKDAKAAAKDDKKDAKADAKAEKADAKAEKAAARAEAKAEKAEAKADAKSDKPVRGRWAEAAKPAASAAKK